MSIFSSVKNLLGFKSVSVYPAIATKPITIESKLLPFPTRLRQLAAVDKSLDPTEIGFDTLRVAKLRRFDLAIPSNTQSDWHGFNTTGSYDTFNAARRMRYLARDLEENNPHAEAFLRELCANVHGSSGIRFYSKVKNQKGGRDNGALNTLLTDAWKDFRRKGQYDVTGLHSGIQADNLLLRAIARDGEVLIRLIRGYPGNKFRFAIQMLECDALDIYYNVPGDINGNRITMGCELDSYGRPLAYHLLDYSQQDIWANNTAVQRVRVLAKDLLHVYIPKRISNVRGVTWFCTTGAKMRSLERYEDAIAVANRIAASRMGFYTRGLGGDKYTGQGETATGEIIEEVSPGEMTELPVGMDVKSLDFGQTPESYHDFRKSSLRSIASGLGLMYNSLSNDLESVNYSSARFGHEQEVEFWKDLQRFYAENVLQPIFEAWLEMFSLTNNLPGIPFDQLDRIKLATRWRCRGWTYIDPAKDAQAASNKIDMGLSTRGRELAEEGLELEEVYEELEREKELAAKYGLVFVNAYSRNPLVESTADTVDAGEATPGADIGGKPQKPTPGAKPPKAAPGSSGN